MCVCVTAYTYSIIGNTSIVCVLIGDRCVDLSADWILEGTNDPTNKSSSTVGCYTVKCYGMCKMLSIGPIWTAGESNYWYCLNAIHFLEYWIESWMRVGWMERRHRHLGVE